MRSNRGFTLPEMMIVVAVIGIFAGLALPNFSESMRRADVNAFVRELSEDISEARVIATSNAKIHGTDRRIRSALIRFQDSSGYQIVVTDSPTGVDGTIEQTRKTVQLPDGLRLVGPLSLPKSLVFRSSGAMMSDSFDHIVLEDVPTRRPVTIEIGMLGTIELR
jgi:prepilin-type N-terminal cleavage/methylation domain-containing protein